MKTTISEILADANAAGLLLDAVDNLIQKRQGQLRTFKPADDRFREVLADIEQLTRWSCELKGIPYLAPLPR